MHVYDTKHPDCQIKFRKYWMRGFLPSLMLTTVSYLLYGIIQIKVLIKTQPTQDSYSYDIIYKPRAEGKNPVHGMYNSGKPQHFA